MGLRFGLSATALSHPENSSSTQELLSDRGGGFGTPGEASSGLLLAGLGHIPHFPAAPFGDTKGADCFSTKRITVAFFSFQSAGTLFCKRAALIGMSLVLTVSLQSFDSSDTMRVDGTSSSISQLSYEFLGRGNPPKPGKRTVNEDRILNKTFTL